LSIIIAAVECSEEARILERKGHDPAGQCMTSQLQIIKRKLHFELDTRPYRTKTTIFQEDGSSLEIISTGRKWIKAFYSGGTGPAVLI